MAEGDLSWSPDGRYLASASGCNGCVLDAVSGQCAATPEVRAWMWCMRTSYPETRISCELLWLARGHGILWSQG